MADRQSVPTTPIVSEAVSYDGGKRIKGRKRHLLVDSLGLLRVVAIAEVSRSKGAGLRQLLTSTEQRGVDDGSLALDIRAGLAPNGSRLCVDASTLGGGEELWLVALVSSPES